MSSTDVLWLVFITKEAFLISVPVLYCIIYLLVGLICLILSPLIAGYYYGMVKGKKLKEKAFKNLLATLQGVVAAQALVIGSLFLNLSTSFRMALLADQLVRRKVKSIGTTRSKMLKRVLPKETDSLPFTLLVTDGVYVVSSSR